MAPGRSVAGLLAIAAIGAALTGCSDEPSSSGAAHIESNADHARATDQEIADGALIVSHLGSELYGPIAAAAGDGNVAFSPLSIATPLAMARAGAEGDSAEQLDDLFGATDPTTLGRSVNGATEGVQALAGPVQLANGEMGEIELTSADALWGQSNVTWTPAFLDALRTDFDASMWTADYARDPDRARLEINDWVAEHTREHIPNLLPQGSIDELTRLVLTNAVFFKAPWPAELHEPKDTAPFTTATGDTVDAHMLVTTGSMAYQQGDGWQAASLPYAGKKLAMTFIVPDGDDLTPVEAAIADGGLADLLPSGEPATVTLTFPKLDLDQRSPVGDVLKGLGVTAPFTTETDFAPMSSDPEAKGLHIADVLHQATVTVDRYGTEAAAATAVTMAGTGMPVDPKEVTADHPFVFVIHDVANGTPIFIGRVTNPEVA